MTDTFTLIDAALWSIAAALFAGAVWLVVRDRPDQWDPSVFFGGVLAALFGKGNLPLRGGPVPEEGWDGEPSELEAVYEPAARLAPGLTWSAVQRWSPDVGAALERRLADVRILALDPLPMDIPGMAVERITADQLEVHFDRPEQRAVFFAGASADVLLRALHASGRLRDRARAVLFVAPTFDRAWLPTITHTSFEVDVAREVPYLTLRAGPSAEDQLLPEPPRPASGILALATIDLGVLPEERLADPRVGRALGALLAAVGP
jgi:hypothetical protein